ncbi:hypothetical protein ID866_11689, partial [Astraeus odoratus]
MPVCAPALHTTTLLSSATHACACTLTPCATTSHHLPPTLHTTPPIVCPHTHACTLAPCTTTSHRLLPTPMRAPALHTTTL